MLGTQQDKKSNVFGHNFAAPIELCLALSFVSCTNRCIYQVLEYRFPGCGAVGAG